MPAYVDPDACTGCESCVDVCPVEAISMQDDLAVVDESICTESGECIETCPVEAISMKESAD